MPAEALIAIEKAIRNRRIGENGGDQRRDTHPRTEHGHCVLFIAIVNVGLDRGGLFHHSLPHGPHLPHIGTHNSIAPLWHPLDFLHTAHRLNAQAKKGNIQLLRHLQQLPGVLIKLSKTTMDTLAGLTTQLNLPPGF